MNPGTVPEIKRHGGRRPGAGRPPTRFRDAVAVKTGLSPRTQRRAETRIAFAETYPAVQPWSERSTLRAEAIFRRIPEADRGRAAEALALPPKLALSVLLGYVLGAGVSR